jgi:hypothetical protein
MSNKDDIISKIYFDKSGYGSIKTTFEDAKKKDKSITIEDVKKFFEKNVEKKTQAKNFNSFVAPYPYYEYQFDLFFIKDLENQKQKVGAIMIDIFTKYMWVVAIDSKSEGDVASALIECINKMGHKPEILYTDDETALSTKAIQEYLQDEKIKHIITRSHAWFAERAIRTFKEMLYKRIEGSKEKNIQWKDFINEILITYNHKLKHSSTNHTPYEAKNNKNELNVKISMLMHARHNRKYPILEIGNKVKIYRKKRTGEKSHTSYWSEDAYELEKITQSLGQPYFKVKGLDRLYLRNELLKVS